MTSRRGFILGAASLLAAPAIVRASSLMPVKSVLGLPPGPPPIEMLPHDMGFSVERLLEARRILDAATLIPLEDFHYYIPPALEERFAGQRVAYRVVPLL